MGHHRVKINPSLAKALLACHGGETTVFKGLKPEDVKGLKDTARHHGYMPPKALAKKPIEAFHQFLQKRGKVFEPKKLGEAVKTPGQPKKKLAQAPETGVRALPLGGGGPAVGAGNAAGVAEDTAYPMSTKSKEQLHDRIKKSGAAYNTSRVRSDPEVAKFFQKDVHRAEDELKRRQGDKPWWVKEARAIDLKSWLMNLIKK